MPSIPKEMISRLVSSQTGTATALTNSLRSTQILSRQVIVGARAYHRSALLQEKAPTSSPAPSSTPQQNKSRKSFFWQRRDRKETRNRISTLALDPSATTDAEARETEHQSQHQSGSRDGSAGGKSRGRLMSRTQRRILLFTVVLSIPIIGRDVMEVVIPGLLGTIIFVGGKVKSGIKWVRHFGSE